MTGGVRRAAPAILLLLGILAILLGACTQHTEDAAGDHDGPRSARTAEQPSPTPRMRELIPTQSERPAKAASPSPTATATTAPLHEGVDEPCGMLLPLLASIEVPEVGKIGERAVPQGVIPEAALPAFQRILAAPETVGLAAYQVGRESEGIYINAEAPMPLASVVKIVNLVAYAEAVAAGEIDPAAWIPLSEIERLYLPGMDLGAHNRSVSELRERGLVAFEPPATPMEEIPWLMIRHSSNGASDYLHMLLGQERIEQTALDLGLESQTAPCPWLGQFLAMSNHTRARSNDSAIRDFIRNPDSYGNEVMRLTEAYANSEAFRAQETAGPRRRPSLGTQVLFSENLNAQASARDYAKLMALILRNGLGSPYANILTRRVLEWPASLPANQQLFATVGYKNGSLPGILTTVYYAQRLEDGAQVIVALFFRQLPLATYRSWRRDLPHDELARWILAEPAAIELLRGLLTDDP